jgi:hypothetical protein
VVLFLLFLGFQTVVVLGYTTTGRAEGAGGRPLKPENQ